MDYFSENEANVLRYNQPEIKHSSVTARSAYLVLYLEIDSECRLKAKLYDECNNSKFVIANFPLICGDIPVARVYGIHFSRSLRFYQDLNRGLLQTKNPWIQGS